MATALDKIEGELCALMGDTGKLTLQRCLRKMGKESDLTYFERVTLVDELAKTFSILMPEDQVWRFRLKLSSLKGDDDE